MNAIIRTENLTKTFSKFIAVNDVTLKIPEGQVMAIIGPNGAGKTTLINLLTGRLIPDRGRVFFRNADITSMSSSGRVCCGIGRSFQITNIFPRLTVRENVAIPALAHAKQTHSVIRRLAGFQETHKRVDKILEEVGLGDLANLIAGQLSHGDQRRLEIALALTTEPCLLILDEPTAGMNPRERKKALELLGSLAKSGRLTLLIIEHDMDVVFSLADRIVVLNQGSLLAEGSPDEIRKNPRVLDIYLGAAIAGAPEVQKAQLKLEGEKILEVKEIDTFYGLSQALHSVSLKVHKGEAVALLGRNGVGKTTTLRCIMGLNPPRRGSIRFCGEEISRYPSYSIASRGIGYVPDDRRIFPNLSTLENLMLPAQVRWIRKGHWTVDKVAQIFPQLAKIMDRKGRFLSGGEQKMLSIGRALMGDPSLLLLDEPSEGLSPLVLKMLLEALDRIREEGLTTLVADQNVNFAHAVADRAYILDKGAIAYDGAMEELWADKEVLKTYLAV